MNIYRKSNIISYWDEVLSKEEYEKLYNEIKYEILNDLLRSKYVDMIFKGREGDDSDREIINDVSKWF